MSDEKTTQRDAAVQNPPATDMSAALRLEIIKEVEARFEHLPAATLKLIQDEADERVAKAERHYTRLGIVTVALFAIIIAIVLKATWDKVPERVSELIADTQVKKQANEVQVIHGDMTQRNEQTRQDAAEVEKIVTQIKGRVVELQSVDNLVTYTADGQLILRPVDGTIRLRQKGVEDVTIQLRMETTHGHYFVDHVFKDKPPHTVIQHGPGP